MKINKRKCRAYADPGLRMQKGSGILCAEQIDYIIRTAVKIIDHHRVLIIYIYSRTQAVQGDFRPRWTIFQTKDDYITLERREDGSTTWRNAAFESLGDNWDFVHKCAFYSLKDEARLCQYFKSVPGAGFRPLLQVQMEIQSRRRKERQRVRESKVIARMSGIPSLPRGLKGWIHKEIMPAYFFYTYKRGGRDVPGTCSACGHEIYLSGVKQGNRAVCPHCKHELIMKPRSRRGYCTMDRDTCQVLQNMGKGELVSRIVKVQYIYADDTPKIQMYENARLFIRQDADGKTDIECYYHQYDSGVSTDWKKGERPVYNKWSYNYEADTCGHVYTMNLPEVLQDTPWKYCPISEFYNHFREPMQALPFLGAYLRHPRMEHLIKTGFYQIASDLAYAYPQECIDETKDRTHQILGVAAEDVPFLRGLGIDLSTLKMFQGYAGAKDRQELLIWQLKHDVRRDILPILQHMTIHKALKYMDQQYEALHLQRYRTMQALVSEYRDHLSICEKLGYDMGNDFVLYPRDLPEAHDKAACRLEAKKNAQLEEDFQAVYQGIAGRLDYEKDGLMIICPATSDDVVAEGHALHHCVGTYVSRVARHECLILFVRLCSAPDRPFYTVEIRGNEVVQVRGRNNSGATPEVDTFVKTWEQRVLRTRLPAVAA